jgi:hypothetical protein
MNITQDDLLKYLYKEGTPEKIIHIRQQLESDVELQERLFLLKTAKSRLDKIELISPDDRTVDNIFNYSKHGVITEVVYIHN